VGWPWEGCNKVVFDVFSPASHPLDPRFHGDDNMWVIVSLPKEGEVGGTD